MHELILLENDSCGHSLNYNKDNRCYLSEMKYILSLFYVFIKL